MISFRQARYFLALLFLLATLFASPASGADGKKRVLLLHSYHSGYQWTDDITQAVNNTLKQNDTFSIDLRIEYLDSKRYASDQYYELFRKYMLKKYANQTFDVIICSDNNALNFLVENRSFLFPEVPIVFCGINYFKESLLKGEKGITGVNEVVRNDITFDLMRKVHPSLQRIVVVTDTTVTGKILLEDIKVYAEQHREIEWLYLPGDNREHLLQSLKSLGDGDLVYLNLYLKDDKGPIESDESAELISSTSPVPVYDSMGFILGHGVIGGYMTSAKDQGLEASKMVLEILNGTPPGDIPVVMKSPNIYRADFSVITSFGIDADSFPQETVFIKKPVSFYHEHKTAILITLFLLTGLTILSFCLTVNTIRKKRVERALLTLTSELEDRVLLRTQELQEAFDEIHQSREKMNRLLSNLSGMVYRCKRDSTMTMQFVSDAANRVTGYQPIDLINNKTVAYYDLIHENDKAMVNEALTAAIENKTPFTIEYRIITKSLDLKWVWEQGMVFFTPEGDVSYLDGIITDITEKKLIELEQKKLAIAVQQTDDLIFITSSKGIIEYINPAFERVTGYSIIEVRGKNPRILKSGKHDKELYKNLWATIKRGDVYRGQFVNNRKDGTEYTAEVTISPIRDQFDEITHFVSVQRDITNEKSMERELRHAQKLESLGTLAGGIAHEINTPSQFVTSNLSFAQESFQDIHTYISEMNNLLTGEDDEKDSEDIEKRASSLYEEHDIDYLLEEFPLSIKQSLEGIEQIARIVLSMKQFAHPGEENKSESDINEAIKNTATVCHNEWKYVADIDFNLANDLPQVNCHISDINQVILNIIVNAAHALETAGFTERKKGCIDICSEQKDQNSVLISIKDNAGGIPESIQENIFDPFFTTKDPGKGTGQGLAIAHSLITEKHNGSLTFTSTDKGTVFYIQLPIEG